MARQSPYLGTVISNNIIKNITDDIDTKLSRALGRWAKSFEGKAKNKKELVEVNKRVSAGAANAIVSAYLNRDRRPSYRQDDPIGSIGHRYSGGQLESALRDPKFISADKGRIRFGNTKILDTNARQWQRLNFGAGAAAGPPEKIPANMMIFGRRISKRVNLDTYGPRPSFRMPRGFFSSSFHPSNNPGGKIFKKPIGRDAFYVSSGSQRKEGGKKGFPIAGPLLTKGIEGQHFLEKGAKYINKHYPEEITRMITIWERQSRQAMRNGK